MDEPSPTHTPEPGGLVFGQDRVLQEAGDAGFVDLWLGQLKPGPLFSLVATKPQ